MVIFWITDALQFPSDLEGITLGFLESMGCENCCLISDILECVDVVEDKAVVFQ